MSQLGGASGGRRAEPARNNVYTVLALIAVLALLAGILFIWYRGQQLTGQSNPFYIEKSQAAVSPLLEISVQPS